MKSWKEFQMIAKHSEETWGVWGVRTLFKRCYGNNLFDFALLHRPTRLALGGIRIWDTG